MPFPEEGVDRGPSRERVLTRLLRQRAEGRVVRVRPGAGGATRSSSGGKEEARAHCPRHPRHPHLLRGPLPGGVETGFCDDITSLLRIFQKLRVQSFSKKSNGSSKVSPLARVTAVTARLLILALTFASTQQVYVPLLPRVTAHQNSNAA